MPKDRTKKLITFDNDLIEQIDDYRFDNRLDSRSEAVRQLIKAGLKKKTPKKKKWGSHEKTCSAICYSSRGEWFALTQTNFK